MEFAKWTRKVELPVKRRWAVHKWGLLRLRDELLSAALHGPPMFQKFSQKACLKTHTRADF